MLLPIVNPGEWVTPGPATPADSEAPAAGGAPVQPASAPDTAPPASAPAPVAAGSVHPFTSQGGPLHAAVKPGLGQGVPEVIQDWTVRVHFKTHELGGNYAVLVFLGDVPADVSQWRSCPNVVGTCATYVLTSFARSSERFVDKTVTEDLVHLNKAIAERSGLSSFEPNAVIPYLKANLHWRVEAVRLLCT
jgi:tyrosinase